MYGNNNHNSFFVKYTRKKLNTFHADCSSYCFHRAVSCFFFKYSPTHTYTRLPKVHAKEKKTTCNLFVDVTQHQWLPMYTMRRQTKKVTEFTFCSTWIRSPPMVLYVQRQQRFRRSVFQWCQAFLITAQVNTGREYTFAPKPKVVPQSITAKVYNVWVSGLSVQTKSSGSVPLFYVPTKWSAYLA